MVEAQFTVRFIEGKRLRDWLDELQQSKYVKHVLEGKTDAEIAQLLGLKRVNTPKAGSILIPTPIPQVQRI